MKEQKITGYRHQLEMLEIKERELYKQIGDLKNKIKEEKERSCSHQFEYAGRDHGGRYYKCSKCGKLEDE